MGTSMIRNTYEPAEVQRELAATYLRSSILRDSYAAVQLLATVSMLHL